MWGSLSVVGRRFVVCAVLSKRDRASAAADVGLPGAASRSAVGARRRIGSATPMTRLSEYLLPTEKQAPADAEAISHKLMVRAGLIRQMGAGMWTWLPAGWRVHQRVVAIIREEMDAIGGQEMLMPVLQPAEPWRKTGRLEIDELFKLTDRKGSELVLAMTHEEAVTFHVAQIVRSYRDLPLILYHFQVKERDEPRPRAGRAAHARVHDEGLLHLRPRPGGPGGALRAARRRLRPHHGAHRAALLPRRVRRRHDGRARARTSTWRRARPARTRSRSADGYAANVEVALREPRRASRSASGYTRDGEPLTIEPAIEVGNIFKLGTRYSEPLGATLPRRAAATSSRSGWAPTGSARRASWPPRSSSSPTSTASPGRARWRRSPCTWSRSASPARPSARPPSGCTRRCATAAWRCSTTTATSGPGEKFADAELLGCPLRLTVGRRSLESGEIEVQMRRGREQAPRLPLGGEPAGAAARRWTSCGRASPRRAAAAPGRRGARRARGA